MKAQNAPEVRVAESTSISPVTSLSPSASIPGTGLPLNSMGTSHESESRHSEIRELAYKLYIERGQSEGHALQDWLEAEAIVRQGGKVAA
jgi:Protein of unknown function (DUF2934)